MIREEDYVSLHTHTDGSHDDGIIKVDELCKKVASLGQKYVAVTDHNSLAAIPRFVDAAKKYGVKPIIGSEFYYVKNAQQSITTKDNERFHMLILAKNDQGLKNLIKIHNESWTTNYFRMNPSSVERGLLDMELLSKYPEGLIVTTACYFGAVPQYLSNGMEQRARGLVLSLKELFGNDFYFEVADHDLPDEKKAFDLLIDFGKKMDVQIVAAQDAHYLEKEDAFAQELLIGTRFGYYSGFKFPNDEFYFKSAEQMSKSGLEDEYILNTRHLAEKIEDYSVNFETPVSEKKGKINLAYSRRLSAFDALSRYSKYKKIPSNIYYSFRNRSKNGESFDDILKSSSKIGKFMESSPMLSHVIKCLTGVEIGFNPQKDLYAQQDEGLPLGFPIERKGAFVISQWPISGN